MNCAYLLRDCAIITANKPRQGPRGGGPAADARLVSSTGGRCWDIFPRKFPEGLVSGEGSGRERASKRARRSKNCANHRRSDAISPDIFDLLSVPFIIHPARVTQANLPNSTHTTAATLPQPPDGYRLHPAAVGNSMALLLSCMGVARRHMAFLVWHVCFLMAGLIYG